MVTAAAGSDAAVVLVDATKLDLAAPPATPLALLPQTRRHALLARLLRVPHIVFAVNKLDAVADPGRRVRARARRARRVRPRRRLRAGRHRADLGAARRQRQPAERPRRLRRADAARAARAAARRRRRDTGAALLPVQFVAGAAASGAGHRARVLWGRVARGAIALGAELVVFPSGEHARVAELHAAGGRVDQVGAGRSAGVVLDRQLDVSRGDWLAAPGSAGADARFRATLAWLDNEPAIVGRKYWLRHGNRWLQGRIAAIDSRLEIATLDAHAGDELGVNDIGQRDRRDAAAAAAREFADRPRRRRAAGRRPGDPPHQRRAARARSAAA